MPPNPKPKFEHEFHSGGENMKKELLWAACLSVVLGAGVLVLTGGNEAEGGPWKPLNDRIETALAVQEGTLEVKAEAGEGDRAAKQGLSKGESDTSAAAKGNNTDKGSDMSADSSGSVSGTAAHGAAEGDKSSTNTVSQAEVNLPAEAASPAAANPGAASDAEKTVAAQPDSSAAPAHINDGKIHINSADVVMLMELPGIGEKKAQAILDYRTQNGPFQNVTDIVKVKGIGAKMLEKMLPDLAL